VKIELIRGVVQKILVNPQYGLTSFTIKGQDGFYSIGKDKPTFQEGDSIQFETKVVGRHTYARDIAPWADGGTTNSAPVAQVAAQASVPKQWGGKPRGGGFGGGAAKDEYWAAKEARDIAKEGEYALTQKRIEIQAARNAAIETAKFMWEKQLCPIPKKVGDQYDAFLALVDELATKYIENTTTRLSVAVGSEGQREAAGSSVDQGRRPVEDGVASRQYKESGSGAESGNWD
jgi:hypothetical protein